MIGKVYNLLEFSVRTAQHVTMLLRSVESGVVYHMLDQDLTRAEEEEVAEHKPFLDSLKGLEAARKYMCQLDSENNNIVMCNKLKIMYTD